MEYEEEEYPQQEENILLEIPPVNGAATDCMELCYSELRRPFQPNAKRNKNFKEKRKSIIFYFYNIIVSYGRYYNKFNHIIINIICVPRSVCAWYTYIFIRHYDPTNKGCLSCNL